MSTHIGLQRESVSSLGNNLFGFVLGSILAILGVLAFNERVTGDIISQNMLTTIARTLPLSGIVVLALYYLLDWYDLNLAVYIDEFVGRIQVTLYVCAALVVASLPPLVLGGHTHIAALITAVYFPLADLQRNRLLEDGLKHVETTAEAVVYGQNMQKVKTLRWALCAVALFAFIFGISSFIWPTPLAMVLVGFGNLAVWVTAYALKVRRSTCFLQVEYERSLRRGKST